MLKKRILLATGIYPPQIGGPAQYAHELYLALTRAGHEVRVKTYTIELRLPVLIRHIYFFFKSLPAIFWADAVIALDTMSVAWPSVCAGILTRTPIFIRTGGDFLWESYVERTGDLVLLRNFYKEEDFLNKLSLKELAIFKITGFTLRHATKIIFSTDWQRQIWKEPYKINLLRTTLIENFYPPQRQDLTSVRGGYSNGEPIRIVAATRPIKWKNLDRLRRIVDKINSERQAHSIPQLILDTQLLSYEENLKRLAKADIAVLISLGDISPNMIMDALSVGCPCIVTRETGIRDRIKDRVIEVDPLNDSEIQDSIIRLVREIVNGKDGSRLAAKEIPSFVHTWDDIAAEFILSIKLSAPNPISGNSYVPEQPVPELTASFSGDFNLLDPESAVSKRHAEYAKKHKALLIGLIGNLPSDLDKNTSLVQSRTTSPDNNSHLLVFRSKFTSRVRVFLDVLFKMKNLVTLYSPDRLTITCQDPFFNGLAGFSLRFLLRKRISNICLEMQLHTDVTSQWYVKHTMGNRLRAILARVLIKRADHVRVVSNRVKAGIVQTWGVNDSKVEVLPVKVDANKFNPNIKPVVDLHRKYPKWNKIVLIASRLEPEKNIESALHAWAKILSNRDKKDIGLVVVGSGSRLSELKSLVNSLGIDGNVTFEGWTQDMPSYYKTADLFLSTSLYEGYGMTLVEASLVGIPIVTTNVGVAEELTKDGDYLVTIVRQDDQSGLVKAISAHL